MIPRELEIYDISVIIPTYNRPDYIATTLKALQKFSICEVIVVDQSQDTKTKKVCSEYNARQVHSKIPSLTIARNLGVKYAQGKLICFIDDDVTLLDRYFDELVWVFNFYTKTMAVGGYDASSYTEPMWLKNQIMKLFALGHYTNNKAEIISAYGNTYPKDLRRIISAQWLPGLNMAFRREVFEDLQFDENFLGYALAEDTDITYRLWKKYPYHGSIYITTCPRFIHRVAQTHRTDQRKRIFINHVDHWYFNYKNLDKTVWQKITWWRCLCGVALNSLRSKDNRDALLYCWKNKNLIKQGRLREFLNDKDYLTR